MATKHRSSSCNAVMFIGVGGIGCELTSACSGAYPRWLLDFDLDALEAYEPAETIPLAAEAGGPDDLSAEAMHQAAEAAAAELAETVRSGTELIVLLGAVGGQTGAVALPILATELRSAQCTVLAFAIEPLPFEGAARLGAATRTLGELEHAADLLIPLPNRPVGELCDPALPVGQALERLRQKLADAIAQLLQAITCGSYVGLQASELRRSLAAAGRGAFGVGVGRGEARVEKAIRDACANSFLTHESCQRASAATLYLLGGRDVSLHEVHAATDLVAQLVGHVPIQVGLSADGGGNGEVRATLLVTGTRSSGANGLSDDPLVSLGKTQDLSFYDGVDLDVPAFLRRRPAFRPGS